MRHLVLGLAASAALVALPAHAQVEIEKPWARATAPGAKVAGGFMTLRNTADKPDRLLGAASPLAERVETHLTVKDGDIMRMREVKGYDIPARGRFELEPGGAHLMFVNIRQPFKTGERIPVVLRFRDAGEVKVELEVGGLAASPHGSKHGH